MKTQKVKIKSKHVLFLSGIFQTAEYTSVLFAIWVH